MGPILHSENVRSFPTQQPPPIHPKTTFDNIDIAIPPTDENEKKVTTLPVIPGNLTITTSSMDDDMYQIDIGHISSVPVQQQSPLDTSATVTNCNKIYTIVSHQIPTNYYETTNIDLSNVHVSTRTYHNIYETSINTNKVPSLQLRWKTIDQSDDDNNYTEKTTDIMTFGDFLKTTFQMFYEWNNA